jgi:CO/xanthine dehydrogenase Mo-binding subunit
VVVQWRAAIDCCPWNGSWNEWPRNSSAISASGAILRAICAGYALGARELGFDRTVIVKAETGARPPSEDMAARIAEMLPGLCNGRYVRLAGIARKSNGPIPGVVRGLGRHRGEDS